MVISLLAHRRGRLTVPAPPVDRSDVAARAFPAFDDLSRRGIIESAKASQIDLQARIIVASCINCKSVVHSFFALHAKVPLRTIRAAMQLHEYLALKKLSPERFAAMVGVHATTIYRLLNGSTIPKRQNLKRILEATGGEVDISDLMRGVAAQEPTREAEPT